MKKYYAESELIINPDGSIFHLHIKPEQLADKVILVGDPGRVALVASHFDTKECEVESREFKTITGTYQGKRITVVSTGIGCDNIDIVMNELDALANIDFKSRYEKDNLRQLQLVRIGTCGGLPDHRHIIHNPEQPSDKMKYKNTHDKCDRITNSLARRHCTGKPLCNDRRQPNCYY